MTSPMATDSWDTAADDDGPVVEPGAEHAAQTEEAGMRKMPAGGAPLSGRGRLAPSDRHPVLLHVVGLGAFVLAGLLGRWTAVEGIALAWPAAGVAATWVAAAVGRSRAVAVLLLGAAAFGTNAATGAPTQVALVFVGTNLVLALSFVAILRRGCPDLWGWGGHATADRGGTLVWIVTSAVAAGTLEALVASAGLALVGSGLDLEGVLAYAGADASMVTAIFVLAHLLSHRLLVPAPRPSTSAGSWLVLSAATVAVHAVVFGQEVFPVAFIALLWLVFVGVRGDVLLAVTQVALAGAVTVVLHVAGSGPFTLIDDVRHEATTMQAFLAASLVAALFTASTRGALDRLTDRLRRAEAQAAAQAELLEAAFESMHEAITVVSEDGRVLRSNQAAREVAAMIGAQMRLGGTVMSTPEGEPIPSDRTPTRRALAGEVVETDVLLRDLDGAPLTFHVRATPLAAEGEGAVRALAVFRDVTRERALVDDLEHYAATVAHDLRGPLTGVRGWADLVAQVLAQAEDSVHLGPETVALVLQAAERIRAGTDRMDGLIGDLLVQATSRGAELDLRSVDLADLAGRVVTDRGLEHVVRVAELPEVRGDAVLLRHLLDNLVGNAVAHARPGVPVAITVTGERFPAGEGPGGVLLRVSDNGRGVPADLRKRIFQRFERVPGTGVEGTGLGLSICRTIAERHGGSIWVSDGPGGTGSTFTVRLPNKTAQEPVDEPVVGLAPGSG